MVCVHVCISILSVFICMCCVRICTCFYVRFMPVGGVYISCVCTYVEDRA